MTKFVKFLSAMAFTIASSCAASQEQLDFIDYTPAIAAMPGFTLVDARNGNTYNSADHGGAVFLLEFYFNTCPACNQNVSNFKRLEAEYHGVDKIQMLEVSIDCDSASYSDWLRKHGSEGPVLNGCRSALVDSLGVSRFPTTIVFGPDGREAMRGVGVWSGATYTRLKRYLDQVK